MTHKEDETKNKENLTSEQETIENIAKSQNPYLIPLSIIFAGMFVAGAVYFSGPSGTTPNKVAGTNDPGTNPTPAESGEITFRPISEEDHIRGDRNAPVKIIEYSDTECPFCKSFHPTMQRAVDEYDGQVAWVYRHFPLDQIHSKARKEAEATECANELGGNDAFWAYVDRLFEVTPSNDGLDLKQLPEIAAYVGLNRSAFQSCLDSGKYADHVADDLQDAINAGGQGTPYSIVIAPNGETFPISGAQPYASVKSVIDLALQEK